MADTDQLTADQIAQLKHLLEAGVTKEAPVAAVAEPAPLKFSFGGNEYTARDEADLQRIMGQVDQARNAEYETARIRETQRDQQLQREQRAAPGADQFDKEEYAKLFLDDPRKANRYAMQHDPEQMRFYGNLVGQVEQLKQEAAAQQFLISNPDYERTPQNYKVLESIMRQYNLPNDANGFGLAFITAKQSGAIGAQAATAADTDDNTVVPINTPTPPRAKRGGRGSISDDSDVLSRFQSLSPDKMKEFLLAQSG